MLGSRAIGVVPASLRGESALHDSGLTFEAVQVRQVRDVWGKELSRLLVDEEQGPVPVPSADSFALNRHNRQRNPPQLIVGLSPTAIVMLGGFFDVATRRTHSSVSIVMVAGVRSLRVDGNESDLVAASE